MGQSKSQLFLTFLKPSKKSPKLSKNLQKKLKLELEAVSKIWKNQQRRNPWCIIYLPK